MMPVPFEETGLSDPAKLQDSGSITVQEDGVVVEDLDISGCLHIKADDVTVRNVRIRCDSWYSLRIYDVTGTVVHNSDIASTSGLSSNVTGGPVHFHHNRIVDFSAADGVHASSGSTYEYNWIEVGKPDGHSNHVDAIQTATASDVVVRGNVLTARAADGGNAAIIVKSDLEPIAGWTIEGNYLNGGNYTFYWRDGGHGCPMNGHLHGNRFGRDHRYGLVSTGGCELDESGNVWNDSGEPAG